MVVVADAGDRISELLDPGMPEWVREGVRQWMETDGATLSQCLGLSRRSARVALRDHHIRRAFETLDSGASIAKRCHDLATAISRFEANAWPRLRERDEPDPAWSAQRRSMFRAFRAAARVGVEVPRSSRQIREIIGVK